MTDNNAQDPLSAIKTPSANFSSRDLKRGKKEEEHIFVTKQHVQSQMHSIAILFLKSGAVILLILVAVRVAHLIIPPCYRWLPAEDLNGIDKMLFSGAFGGLVLSYLKEMMTPEKKDQH